MSPKLLIILAFAAVPFVYVAIVMLTGRKGRAATAFAAARASHDQALAESRTQAVRVEQAAKRLNASLDDLSSWLGG